MENMIHDNSGVKLEISNRNISGNISKYLEIKHLHIFKII